MTGHLLGAAGSVEAIFTALSVKEQVAPPTINLHNPEPKIRLDLVANQAKKANIENALCNSFGFGGTNGSLLIGKVD
jgi:3-oxoacyl-[acyl-carrier-protein] synthase II